MSDDCCQSIYQKLLGEPDQATLRRKHLLSEIGRAIGGRVAVSYYTSFVYDVMISDRDIAVLEDVLMASRLHGGLLLILSSPGGSGMAAERILNLCRQYSDGAFHVLVPKQAKSAATMICFGADVIHMSKTSELGPIDPQVPEAIGDSFEFIPADLVINSYRRLLQEAAACEGRVEPYLQQLQRYDSRKIAMLERSQELGEDIAVTALQQSMMKGLTPQAIRKRIRLFTKAETKKAHGRPILIDQARECGLNVEETDIHGPLWRQIMELHLRSDMFVSQDHCKLIESAGLHFSVPARRE